LACYSALRGFVSDFQAGAQIRACCVPSVEGLEMTTFFAIYGAGIVAMFFFMLAALMKKVPTLTPMEWLRTIYFSLVWPGGIVVITFLVVTTKARDRAYREYESKIDRGY